MGEPAKKCCTCQQIRPLTDFNVRRAAKDGLQSRCRSCSAEWYAKNRTEHRKNVAARNAAIREQNRVELVEYLEQHPCVDCGETDVRVLDFDHRDPLLKRALVTKLARWSLNWDRVLDEIEKCDVRCANCHRRRTAEMNTWYRHLVHLAAVEATRVEVSRRLARILPAPT